MCGNTNAHVEVPKINGKEWNVNQKDNNYNFMEVKHFSATKISVEVRVMKWWGWSGSM